MSKILSILEAVIGEYGADAFLIVLFVAFLFWIVHLYEKRTLRNEMFIKEQSDSHAKERKEWSDKMEKKDDAHKLERETRDRILKDMEETLSRMKWGN